MAEFDDSQRPNAQVRFWILWSKNRRSQLTNRSRNCAGPLDLDPDKSEILPDEPRPPSLRNAGGHFPGKSDRRGFAIIPAIVLVVCIGLLGILYGIHLASVAFAEMKTVHPSLGWAYAMTLAVMMVVLGYFALLLIVQYRSLKNISVLQLMARLARSQSPLATDTGRNAILEYLAELQNRGDAQTKRSIGQLRTILGQYAGDLARDFCLFEELVLEHVDRRVDGADIGSRLEVAVATALATRLFDPLIVAVQAVRIVRETATAYRGRPGFFGTLQLVARAASAAIFAEIMADLLAYAAPQLAGAKVAAKLGARLGEGLTNGFVMLRLGEATKRLCRPVPLPPADYSQSLKKLVTALLFQSKAEGEEPEVGPLPT